MTTIYEHWSADSLHFSTVKTDDTHKIKCGRCDQLMDYAEEAEGCRDWDCPMREAIEGESE